MEQTKGCIWQDQDLETALVKLKGQNKELLGLLFREGVGGEGGGGCMQRVDFRTSLNQPESPSLSHRRVRFLLLFVSSTN